MININKKDVLWSYFSKFFNLASGLLILPLMLTMLSEDEVGMNYLMLTIGSLVTLLDFGFAPQFGRNISYLYSGAQELKKEGVVIPKSKFKINYKLLATMICTAKYVRLKKRDGGSGGRQGAQALPDFGRSENGGGIITRHPRFSDLPPSLISSMQHVTLK